MSDKVTVWYMVLLAIIWLAAKATSSKVSQLPKDLDVAPGTNVTMFCQFPISQDTVDVHWWKEGRTSFVKPDSRKQFAVEKGRGILVLLNVNVADSGMYYCEAKHRRQSFGNGSGSQLTVFAPPTPLIIVPVGRFLSPRKLMCKTAAFYPEKLKIFWRRNNMEILTGIETVKNRSAEGLYEAFSFLEITQSASGKDIYTCLVSHVSLTVPASFSYILEQGTDTKLIIACAVLGSAILVLIILLVKFRLKRLHGVNTNSLEACQNEEPARQAPVEHTTTYAALNLRENKGVPKGRRGEHVVYSQTKRSEADKLTYASLQHTNAIKTSGSEHKNKHTVYADINASKKV